MLPAGFEPMISAGERPQTYALHRTVIGTGKPISLTLHQQHLLYSTYRVNLVCGRIKRDDLTKVINFVDKLHSSCTQNEVVRIVT
jgi:hypothetical protein